MSHAVKKVGHVISKGWHKLTHGVEHLGKEIIRHPLESLGIGLGVYGLATGGIGGLLGGVTGTATKAATEAGSLLSGVTKYAGTALKVGEGLMLAKGLTTKAPEMPEMPAQPQAPQPVGTIDTRTLLGSGIEDLVKPTKTRYSSLYGLGVAKELG